MAAKISVITWDASFREHTHTIDVFCKQTLKQVAWEFIWVEYYTVQNKKHDKIMQYDNASIIELQNKKEQNWHLGKCINAGVAKSSGDLLIIPDGDIVVEPDFLEYVYNSHHGQKDLVIYFRRYDELPNERNLNTHQSLEYLKNHTSLINPTNYGGCLTLRRSSFEKINGYEEHSAFCGPGCQGMETYTRLSNAAMAIKWAPDKRVYHPWHPCSGNNLKDPKVTKALEKARGVHAWIKPYAGLEQSWITHSRTRNLDYQANSKQAETYLQKMPRIDLDKWLNQKK